ncbi:MAG: D-alanyl-D-alanine carboxypeptidase/D-alanyl-D-alanine-endopeptidase [Actinobacteria bacterium]|nr:D-alanyl-D-alanine carboxypeptidase/D-alanyl-D-alanine-endopeptidase [Actinomycetota bacterium]
MVGAFRIALAALAAALSLPSAAGAAQHASLQERLSAALASGRGVAGALVVDLRTGATVFAQNADLPLAPASNQKLGVTYAALTGLGRGFRIATDVLGRGMQDGTTWNGDLVLKGYGDPTLSGAGLAKLARQVAADGITRVTGRVVGDESWFDSARTGVGWKPSFFILESPPLSALIVNRGWDGRRTSRQPALTAAQLFRAALGRAGVKVAGGAAVGVAAQDAQLLAEIESPPVSALVHFMDLYSDNFTAEMLIKQVGAVQAASGTAAAGIGVELSLLQDAGVPLDGVHLADGSGLSQVDRWTATGLVSLLRAMWQDPALEPDLLSALPIAGVNGTLQDRMERGPAYRNVRAKTGTTDECTALSGFVRDRYVFSILINGHPVSWTATRSAEDRFAQVLASAATAG